MAEGLDTVAGVAGWSVARTVAHFVRLGLAAQRHQQRAVDELSAAYLGAVKLHAVELENAKRLADVRKSLRTPAAGKGSRPGTSKAAKDARRPGLPPLPAVKPDAAA